MIIMDIKAKIKKFKEALFRQENMWPITPVGDQQQKKDFFINNKQPEDGEFCVVRVSSIEEAKIIVSEVTSQENTESILNHKEANENKPLYLRVSIPEGV